MVLEADVFVLAPNPFSPAALDVVFLFFGCLANKEKFCGDDDDDDVVVRTPFDKGERKP